MKKHLGLQVLVLSAIQIFLGSLSHATISISPGRLVLSDNKRTEAISLKNTSNSTTTVLVDTVYYKMGPNLNLEEVKEKDKVETSATTLVQFSPRVITLKPNETQLIRAMTHYPKNLSARMYRAHLKFQEVPNTTFSEDDSDEAPRSSSGKQQVKMQMHSMFSISIPIQLTHGAVTEKLAISDLTLTKNSHGDPVVKATFNNSGTTFPFGNISVQWISDTNATTEIGKFGRMSIYEGKIPLELPVEVPNKSIAIRGKIKMQFFKLNPEQPNEQPAQEPTAEAIITL